VACGSSSPGTPPDGGVEASTDSGADAAAPACGSIESFVPDWVKNAAPSKEVYVAPSGNDQNDGSVQSPLATAAKAFSMLGPGVRLNFKTGTYACPPPVVDVLATTATPMIVRAVDGPRTAKFDCGGNGDFYFSHVRAVIVDGVEIANASGHGVQLDSGSGFATKDLSCDCATLIPASWVSRSRSRSASTSSATNSRTSARRGSAPSSSRRTCRSSSATTRTTPTRSTK